MASINSKGFVISVDDRERHVRPFLEEYAPRVPSCAVQVMRMTVGDYAISLDDKLLTVIERKTWADLAASIKDNRIANIQKLIAARQATACNIIYIIEGKLRAECGGIACAALVAHLDHLMIRDGVSVIYTRDQAATALRILTLAKNMMTIQNARWHDNATHAGGAEAPEPRSAQTVLTARQEPPSDTAIMCQILSALPGISAITAPMLLDQKITLCDVAMGRLDCDRLANLRYPSGAMLGRARAQKICCLGGGGPNASLKQNWTTALAMIPGVSKGCAANIMAAYGGSIADLMTFILQMKHVEDGRAAAIARIAQIKKTDKCLVGPRLATRIVDLLGADGAPPANHVCASRSDSSPESGS